MSSKLRKLALELSGEKQKRRQSNKIKKMIRQHKHQAYSHKLVRKEDSVSHTETEEVDANTAQTTVAADPSSAAAENPVG